MGLNWILFLKQPRLQQFEYLDEQTWSFKFSDVSQPIQRRHLHKIIDHHYYIVLYFAHKQHKPCLIWWDQLSRKQWKKLKILAKML